MRKLLVDILPIFIALGFGGLILVVGGRYPPAGKIGGKRIFRGMVKVYEKLGIRYRMERFLEKNGVVYHYGRKCGLKQLCIVSLVMMAAGWVIGLKQGIFISLALGGVGLMLPWLILPMLNRADNERMLSDIRLVYHTLATQIRAGVYVTDALTEIYSGVENIRLKEALLDLGGDIVLHADLITTLDRFQARFDNRYIDSLCITIIQAMESGQAVELLQDIAEQVKDVERTVLEKKKASLDRCITFCQLGMLSCVLAVAIYACLSYMFSASLGF